MSALLSIESIPFSGQNDIWSKSLNGMHECVFKKCCEKYKKKGKHCKKVPQKIKRTALALC